MVISSMGGIVVVKTGEEEAVTSVETSPTVIFITGEGGITVMTSS